MEVCVLPSPIRVHLLKCHHSFLVLCVIVDGALVHPLNLALTIVMFKNMSSYCSGYIEPLIHADCSWS